METDRELLEQATKADGLKIYLVSWVSFGDGLSAVVAANDDADALKTLNLSNEYSSDIKCRCVGICNNAISAPDVLCQESF